ncbi:hypothetical protein CDLVIII_0173 [Clostridium sp. DL-VIII]|uniref:hypothetical protein n=1 Tax=Clostridium sp. DL-VIII TaxID=641107 RepID=UPI00023AF891|nr:hypothetical protein [Clostridium sp. DL-VIII]EHI96911.1 hypothetical protein CDLVIII_0173 [Clostridium sp. DL-VIII]
MVKKVNRVKGPTPIISEQTAIVLKKVVSNLENGVGKAKIISFEGTTPVNTATGTIPRAKVGFEIYMNNGTLKTLLNNFLLINHPNQQIYKLFITAVGRIDNVTPKDVIGKEVGIEIKNVTTDAGTFSNIVDIFSVDELEDGCNDTVELQNVDNSIEEYEY